MLDTDFFYTLAEVAVAFVGFSAIITALRRRQSPLSELERWHMTTLVERSLAVVVFSLLPTLLNNLGFVTETTLRMTSVLLGTYFFITPLRSVLYHISHTMVIEIKTYWIRISISLITACMMLFNGAGMMSENVDGVYMLGVSMALMGAGLAFFAMLQSAPDSGFEPPVRQVNVFGRELPMNTNQFK